MSIKIDRFAQEVFREFGFDAETDEHLCETYINFKRYKDLLQPGKLTAEGYALVATFADLTRGVDEVERADKNARKARAKRSRAKKKEDDKKPAQKPKPMTEDEPKPKPTSDAVKPVESDETSPEPSPFE